jgi:purine-binding chemotaxis protein CheW
MSHLIASQKVIQHYLSALLTEDEPLAPQETALAETKKAELNRLLAQATPVAAPVETAVASPVKSVVAKPVAQPPVSPVAPAVLRERSIPIAERLAVTPPPQVKVEKAYRQGSFQALFFSVAGLKIAVPLTELGGIHELGPINNLPGKADWFKGIMLHRAQKIQLVDTARWVMPEKYTATLATELNYQYVIMLGTSNWGLCCELLIDTINLEPEQIKWREQEGKRPWMAGLIKEQKCVLLDVDELVNLLNQGLDVNA